MIGNPQNQFVIRYHCYFKSAGDDLDRALHVHGYAGIYLEAGGM